MTLPRPVPSNCAETGAEALAAWLRLTLISGIGGETQRKLLKAFGLPQAIFSASFSMLRGVVGDKAAQLLLANDNTVAINTALQWAEGEDQRILTLADAEYPQSLLEIPDPPSLLYVRGRCELLNQASLTIVGSRNPTPQGIQNAEKTKIDSLELEVGQSFDYLFDFGDSWEHVITVEETEAQAEKGIYPRILEKCGESPPQYPEPEEYDADEE